MMANGWAEGPWFNVLSSAILPPISYSNLRCEWMRPGRGIATWRCHPWPVQALASFLCPTFGLIYAIWWLPVFGQLLRLLKGFSGSMPSSKQTEHIIFKLKDIILCFALFCHLCTWNNLICCVPCTSILHFQDFFPDIFNQDPVYRANKGSFSHP